MASNVKRTNMEEFVNSEKECIIKNLLQSWISRDNYKFLSSYNFITKENSNKYRVSVNERTYDDEIFLTLYDIWISDNEFRIIEID